MAIRTYSTATANCLMTDAGGMLSVSMTLQTSANENTSDEPWKKTFPSIRNFYVFLELYSRNRETI